MPRVETMYWRWGRAMGGHAYYSLEATVGQWTMGWAISGSLALAYLKCVPCAIQFPRILQRHLPNSAPLAKTRPRHRHRDRDRRVQHEKKRRQWQRHRGASIHPGAKRQPCIICIAQWGWVEQEQSWARPPRKGIDDRTNRQQTAFDALECRNNTKYS